MKRIRISPEIRKAIRLWCRDGKLTQTQIGDLIGVSNPTVNSWINGKILSIRPSHWVKLHAYLKPICEQKHIPLPELKDDLQLEYEDAAEPYARRRMPLDGDSAMVDWVRIIKRVIHSAELSADEKIRMLKVIVSDEDKKSQESDVE